MDFIQNLLMLFARIFLSATFLLSAVQKMGNWKGALMHLQTQKIPMPNLILFLVLIMQLVGGLSVLLGYRVELGSILLIILLVGSALKMHPFWSVPEIEKHHARMHFFKEVAIIGGLLLLAIHGAGHFAFA